MKKAFLALFFVFICIVFGVGQGSTPSWAQDSSSPVIWTRLAGTAVDISINSQGQAYAVAPDGTPWRWDAMEQRWRAMSGDFIRITAAEDNRPWAINAQGVVFRYNGLWWENKDTDVADVAADALGNVYIAKISGEIKKWNPLRSEWRVLEGGGNRIALDMAGRPWTVARDGSIRAFDGKVWIVMPGRALDIAVGGDDTKVIADLEGRVRIWDDAQRRWLVVAGVDGVTAVAAAPDGGPWAVISGDAIMATTLLISPEQIKTEPGRPPGLKAPEANALVDSAPLAVAPSIQSNPANAATLTAPANSNAPLAVPPPNNAQPVGAPPLSTAPSSNTAGGPNIVSPTSTVQGTTDPATQTTKEDITFVDTKQTSETIAIGADGSVFGLDVGGNVLRWSNTRRRFESFPGTLARLAVDPQGNPWGISVLGRVFRHTGRLWKQIPNAVGSDIAIGADGTVVIADAEGSLFKLNTAMTRLERVPGNGLRVAVGPAGVPWTIRSDNQVQRCASSRCDIVPQKATDISIGPDGSVFVISFTGLLLRLKEDGKTFEPIRVPGHTPLKVAVGPNGFPWVVSTQKAVLSAKFFDRDEAQDRAIAASTSGDTQGTGTTASVVDVASGTSFTFSKNMRFDTFSNSLGFMGSLDGIAIGLDDNIYAHVNAGDLQIPDYKVWIFNEKAEKFEDHTANFSGEVEAMDADVDGNIWVIDTNSPPTIYRVTPTGTRTSFSVSGATGSATDLTIGSDGTIYAVIGRILYRMTPGTSSFRKFSNDDIRKVAVGLAGDLWVLDENYVVQQFTGSKFENRPLGQTVKANDIGAGEDGTVYIGAQSDNLLKKWNASNKSFDKVNNAKADIVDVDQDGRPWIAYTSSNTDIKRGKE